jgi:hypothetical protein
VVCAVDGFSVGNYSFSCAKDCLNPTCAIDHHKTKNIYGTLPDVFDRLTCASNITHMYCPSVRSRFMRRVGVRVRTYLCARVSLCARVCARVRTYLCARVCVCLCACVCARAALTFGCVCVSAHARACVCARACVHACVRMCA